MTGKQLLNALSVDLEDWYEAEAFAHDRRLHASRVVPVTMEVLDLFDEFEAKATFFVLGHVAELHPNLIKDVAARGHEIGTHGWSHRLLYEMGPDLFAEELDRSKKLCEDLSGKAVLGHRAACWSITNDSLWALDILLERGFAYDSSIFPTKNFLYGIPDAPRFAHRRENGLLEIPPSTIKLLGRTMPIAGGFFLRALPGWMMRNGIKKLNADGEPAVIYTHPWEFDPKQPRDLAISRTDRVIHYWNLRSTMGKFRKLLTEFRFGRMDEVFSELLQS